MLAFALPRPARSRFLLLAGTALLAHGCGGGGSGGGATTPNATPVAAITTSATSGTATLAVDFSGTLSSDSDGSITGWAWDFGDGATGSGITVQHAYTTAGNYTATLTVTDDDGASDSASIDISVTANTPPVAIVRADVVEGLAPLTVRFDGSASSDADGPLTWHWDFGNGDFADIPAPAALYDVPGQYVATLTVTDSGGTTSSTSITLYVAGSTDAFALAGNVSIGESTHVDCDTAGGGVAGCNQSPANAQALPVPVVAGGHAQHGGDAIDHYRVNLAGGETLALAVADSSPANDLDLRLYAADGTTLIAQSAQPATTPETLVAPAAGTYVVEVNAAAGSSNYVLTIGTATLGIDAPGDFVDGEYIVQFSGARIPWRLDAQGDARANEFGMDVTGNAVDAPLLMREPGGRRAARARLDNRAQERLRDFRRHPDVGWAEPNRIRRPLGIDAMDTWYPLQWNLPLARFPGAWAADTVLRGTGSVVAVIDTGILATHPDFAGRLLAGYDFISDPLNAGDGNGIDPTPTDEGGDRIGRSSFHGSHVAGIIAANTQFSATAGNSGIAGGAPLAQVMPLRVVGRYGASSYDIIQAIRYAAGLSNDSGTTPATPADVINLSIGSTGYSQAEQDAVTAARAAGVIVVAAGGNTGTDIRVYPAAYAGVVGTGAVALDRSRAPYSTSGAHIDLVAPGGNLAADLDGNGFPDGVLSTLADDSSGLVVPGYDFYQGTSMAAPHVAAAAAMMKSLLPTLTPALFDSLLASGALTRDLGAGGRDDLYGMGLLDAEKALVATGMVSATPPVAVASPARLAFGAAAAQALVVVDNGGGGTLSISGSSSDQPWLSVSAQSVDGSGLGTYRIDVDRSALVDGNYSGTLLFTTSAGNLAVPVSLSVDSAVTVPSAGALYVVVWDSQAQAFVPYPNNPPFAGGGLLFDLGDVVAGHYQVYVGTDNDNDGFICDPGEACGAWPTLDEPLRFTHARDRTDLSFSVSYVTGVGTLADDGGPSTRRGIPRR